MREDKPFIPSKEEFLKQIASGQSISKVERAWNMKPASLHYWVSKWGLKGIKPDRAQQLLDEMALDGDHLPEPVKKTAEKLFETAPVAADLEPAARVIEAELKLHREKDAEIERLRDELKKTMTLDRYQHLAARTANTNWDLISVRLIRDSKYLPLLNFALGAAGEAGEIADEVKKVIFHGHNLDIDKLLKEIGDALWYLSQLTRTLGYSFDTVAERNLEKLKDRYPEGFSEEKSQNRETENAKG